MNPSWSTSFTAEADAWRGRLGMLGFGDDGVRLRGFVPWTHPERGCVRARVEVEPDDRFPFAPPAVRVLDPGADLDPTFHIDRPAAGHSAGNLCLWDSNLTLEEVPWRDPQALLDRVRGWLEATAAGWPDDDVCDLERYLEADTTHLVVYDADLLANVHGLVRTTSGPNQNTILVTNERRRRRMELRNGRRPARRDRRLAWVGDLGRIEAPLRSWSDIATRLGHQADEVARLVSFGVVDLLLLRYSRGARSATLAVLVRPGTYGIVAKACESADTSIATRSLRAGTAAPELANARVAIVGLGAVGSFAADLLFRSGVRHLMLIDPERLRPGNVVRHLGGVDDVGDFKVTVVRRRLAASGFDVAGVVARVGWLTRLTEAIELVREHHVVLDATANGRASSLLSTAADLTGRGINHTVISACVQREGQIVRGDRFPLRPYERHLPPLSAQPGVDEVREYGCGEPVSRTPPGAVIAAAELACRMVIDRATHDCALPASMVDVRSPQPNAPFNRLGLVTSADLPTPLAA